MKWTPALSASVTAVVFAALVVLGVTYVVHAQPSDPSPAGAAPAPSASVPDGPTATGSPAPSGPLASATPGYRITLTAAPSFSIPPKPTRTPKPTRSPTPAPPPELDFSLTTFNVLGASHTGRGGTKPRFASGPARAAGAAALLARHRSDVIGFQELQGSQLASLQRRTNLDFYPGFSLGHLGAENSIGWRRDQWVAVEKHTVTIPYFNGGGRQMPFVRLRNLSTGIEAWFANFHNPAETARFHHQQRFRERATLIEASLANRLIDTTGLPVFITGDMNERAPYYCRLTARAPMIAARGGTHNGACLPGRPRAVDWIFGSQDVQFTGYDEDRSHLVDITTDHPVVTARVHLVGEPTDLPSVDSN